MPLGTEVGLSPNNIVLHGDSKCVQPPISARVYCGQTDVYIRIPLGTVSDTVLGGDPDLPPLEGHSPQFSANVRCGQAAGWTKMPLGMAIGLSPGDFVFDGDPAPPPQKAQPPSQFLAHVYCVQKAGWIKMPLGTEVNCGPGDVVLDGVAVPPKRVTAPSFRFMSIVAKRLY